MYSNIMSRILLFFSLGAFSFPVFSEKPITKQQAKNYIANAYQKEVGGRIDKNWYLNNFIGKLLYSFKKATANTQLANKCMNFDPLVNAKYLPQTYRVGNIESLNTGKIRVAVGLNWPTEAMSTVYLQLKKSGNSFKIVEINYINSNNDGNLSQQLAECLKTTK